MESMWVLKFVRWSLAVVQRNLHKLAPILAFSRGVESHGSYFRLT